MDTVKIGRKATMSDNSESSSDEERDIEDGVHLYDESESSVDEEALFLSAADRRLFDAVGRYDADATAAVQRAIRDGANVNAVCTDIMDRLLYTPLMQACEERFDQIIRILLDAGADARWRNHYGWSAITDACEHGHLSTVQLLLNHDNGLLETTSNIGWTPLFYAIRQQHSDIVRFLLYSGADAHHVNQQSGETVLMHACRLNNLEIARLLLDAGVDLKARDVEQQTALHHTARLGISQVMRELISQHNANMFAVDRKGRTPFDSACGSWMSGADIDRLLEMYGNKLTQDHGRLALQKLLQVAKYSFAEDKEFHPPLNPLRIILPLGKLTLKYLRTVLNTLDPELIRNRDDSGKLPIHIACHTNAPVEVLSMILELDPAALRIADYTGALPIHLLCGTTSTTDYASLRYLVEQGGVGTLAVHNRKGLLPLHVLCGSTNPPLRAVQYLIQSFPGSVAVQTNAGEYPFMVAAGNSSASLSVNYELVRANPGLLVPKQVGQCLSFVVVTRHTNL